jgi:hypothetical protein
MPPRRTQIRQAIAHSRIPITGIAGCCARARITLVGSSRLPPPTNPMNSRRSMSSMGDFLPYALSALTTDRAVGFPHVRPAAGRPASPWGRPELF